MPRPKKHRKIGCSPEAYYFKPRAIPIRELEEVELDADEVESIRLTDLESFSHEESASKMKISRATFGRIVNKARGKIADAILNGKAIKINDEFFKEKKK